MVQKIKVKAAKTCAFPQLKANVNKRVASVSAIAGGLVCLLCLFFDSRFKASIPGIVRIPILFSALFVILFFVVWSGSALTGSYDKRSDFYPGSGAGMLKYAALGLAAVFLLTMLFEFLYELNPRQKSLEPTSYIFVIDESGSMEGNDPEGLRYRAIQEIMQENSTLPYMVYTFSSSPRHCAQYGPAAA